MSNGSGFPPVIEGREPGGTRAERCALKPEFILDKLEENRGPVLWVDFDAIVRMRPDLLASAECDFAAHKGEGWCLASGTTFFNYKDSGLELCREWAKACRIESPACDHELLDFAWAEVASRRNLHTTWLPEQYLRVFDNRGKSSRPTVIEHYGGSQTAKAERGHMGHGRQGARSRCGWPGPRLAWPWISPRV